MARVFDVVTHDSPVLILHEFYHKDVARRAVINARSAVPWKAKRTIMQEVLRVLRNCSKHLQWKELCAKIQYSGYNKRFRTEVVRLALCAYDKMREKDESGEEPM